jgi:uncharacterized membrane protein
MGTRQSVRFVVVLLFLGATLWSGSYAAAPPQDPPQAAQPISLRVEGATLDRAVPTAFIPQVQNPSANGAFAYSILGIEPLAPFERSRGLGINNAGVVVGRFYDYNESTQENENLWAFVWDSNSGARLLPTLDGDSSAWEINDSGFAAGYSTNASGFKQAARWDTTLETIENLGTLKNANDVYGESSVAYGINDMGYIAGYSDLFNLTLDFPVFHAFLSHASDMQDLGTLNALYPYYQNGYSIAYERSENGLTIGTANAIVESAWVFRPFLHQDGAGMQELAIDPAYPTQEWYSVAINESKRIGGHVVAATNQSLPYIWASPTSDPQPVSMPPGFPYGEIYAINECGQMIGLMWDSDSSEGALEHAFVLDSRNGIQDLNDMIDPSSGWVLNYARDLNDAGQIVGAGTYMGEPKAFVLTPTEPVLACTVWLPLIEQQSLP